MGSGGREVVEIAEIIERSNQGITQPFLCRGEDGRLYYVKGRTTGRRGKLCEWTAGHLAKALGLPVPDFCVVRVPPELVGFASEQLEAADLGAGFAFASLQVPAAQEFTVAQMPHVPKETKEAIAVFDLWVRNGDRTLTELGGNPNLLWSVGTESLAMIDHNLAYDATFSAQQFLDIHVFRGEMAQLLLDSAKRAQWADRLTRALPAWDEACDSAPSEWWFADEDGLILVDFDRAEIYELLMACATEGFWKLQP